MPDLTANQLARPVHVAGGMAFGFGPAQSATLARSRHSCGPGQRGRRPAGCQRYPRSGPGSSGAPCPSVARMSSPSAEVGQARFHWVTGGVGSSVRSGHRRATRRQAVPRETHPCFTGPVGRKGHDTHTPSPPRLCCSTYGAGTACCRRSHCCARAALTASGGREPADDAIVAGAPPTSHAHRDAGPRPESGYADSPDNATPLVYGSDPDTEPRFSRALRRDVAAVPHPGSAWGRLSFGRCQ